MNVRLAETAETLRGNLVPVTKKIKQDAFSEVDEGKGERLIFVVDWESRLVFVTIVQGVWWPQRFQQGLDAQISVKELFDPKMSYSVNETIGFTRGEPGATKAKFNRLFSDYVLSCGISAQNMLKAATGEGVVGDDVKSQVCALLKPFAENYDYIKGHAPALD